MKQDQVLSHLPNLRRYARALVGDRHAADDLVQDTLERAIAKFHLWRPGDLRAWLFSIMHNVFVNQLRSRRIAVDIEDVAFDLAAPQSPAGQVLDLERCLQRLSAEHREVLLLVSLEDMSYQEVSRALGIPIGTVMSRLARARARLHHLMDGVEAPVERAGIRIVK